MQGGAAVHLLGSERTLDTRSNQISLLFDAVADTHQFVIDGSSMYLIEEGLFICLRNVG